MKNINASALVAWATFADDHASLKAFADILKPVVDSLGDEFCDAIPAAQNEITEKLNFSLHNLVKWAESMLTVSIPVDDEGKKLFDKLNPQLLEQLKLAVSVCKLIQSRIKPTQKPVTEGDSASAPVELETEQVSSDKDASAVIHQMLGDGTIG